ncbi:MAG: hypothetical protein ACRDWV_04135, partial [Acidimicrobiales bacterium]
MRELPRPTIEEYVAAAASYIREASHITPGAGKAAQVRLSRALASVFHATPAGAGFSGAEG